MFRQFDAFKDLARALKGLGCRVGIEYFGQRFAETDKLAGLGLDYIKVHPSYVRGISSNEGNQEFLKGLCNMARALGINRKRTQRLMRRMGRGEQADARRVLELWSLSIAVLLSGLFAFYAARLAWQSHLFNDISTSSDATPLWIPQITMVIGTTVLFIAFLDEWVLQWRGQRRPAPSQAGDPPHE